MGKAAEMLSRFRSGWNAPEKRTKWIVILGSIGILLILLSGSPGKKTEPPVEADTGRRSACSSAESMQQELTRMISSISGAGRAKVLITLQNDGETLYVRERKTERDFAHTSETARSERERTDEKYVLVDGKSGRNALVRTQMEPVVKGVIIACEGGEDPVVVSRIMKAVTTALAVSSAKVCITKLA